MLLTRSKKAVFIIWDLKVSKKKNKEEELIEEELIEVLTDESTEEESPEEKPTEEESTEEELLEDNNLAEKRLYDNFLEKAVETELDESNYNDDIKNRISSLRTALNFSEKNRQRKISQVEQEKNQRELYRRRRHEIASQLLISSANFLFLDKSEGEQLLPLLDPLLSPNKRDAKPTSSHAKDSEKIESWILIDDKLLRDRDQAIKGSLESLIPGAGFRCLVLLLFQYLLSCKEGYDSRIRHPLKRLGVTVLLQSNNCMKEEEENKLDYSELLAGATRRFESLEQMIAVRLLKLAASKDNHEKSTHESDNENSNEKKDSISREKVIRGLKIGAVGAVAGTLLVVTGGAAAGAITAGLSTGLSATLSAVGLGAYVGVYAGVLSFMGSAAAVSIFGTAGGSLAMYKMKRRTDGLTEFTIQKEETKDKKKVEAELHRTICVSGWLRDKFDFQRPWGVLPSDPPLLDEKELLERFYAIYNPILVPDSKKILERYDGKEKLLWSKLEEKYKNSPENLFPLDYGPRFDGVLDGEEEELLDMLILEVAQHHSKCTNNTAAKKGNKVIEKSNKLILNWCSKFPQHNKVKYPENKEIVHETGETDVSEETKGEFLSSKAKTKRVDLLHPFSPLPISEFENVPSAKSDQGSFAITAGDGSKNLKHLSAAWKGNKVREKSNKRILNLRDTFSQRNRVKHLEKKELVHEVGEADVSEDPKIKNVTSKAKTRIGLVHSLPPPSISEIEDASSAENDQTSSAITAGDVSNNLKHLSTVWDFHANYGGELYTVKWESSLMLKLSNSVRKMFLQLAEKVGQEVLKKTIFASLVIASTWPMIVYKTIDSIDGEWDLITKRSKEAGKELAQSLLANTKSGHRPVTLVGYSFGALIIYSCLLELLQYQEEWFEHQESMIIQSIDHSENDINNSSSCVEKNKEKEMAKKIKNKPDFEREPASIIEDVVIMGLPQHVNPKEWEKCREIVSGRLMNVYCPDDKILMLLFRYKNIAGGLRDFHYNNITGSFKQICGTCVVPVSGVENIDVSHIIKGNHDDYCIFAGDILQHVHFGQPCQWDRKKVHKTDVIGDAEREVEECG
uniref:DUF726 domain-containing protein n=1 Tax=Corethron hystrix TaxID=216773 RepID=A0A7S1FKN1_9STRA|mmetsp:Transcript_12104/g.26502  ORF Transcript_12104/g.26502 Transcript_12104/m.26502 type:complete len:1079 (+) Transcript_12104:395-3631(+)